MLSGVSAIAVVAEVETIEIGGSTGTVETVARNIVPAPVPPARVVP
jgi:hypothetical protein